MDQKTKEIAVKLLREWAAAAADPNEPVISMGNGEYSANNVVSEVENETEFGRFFLDSLEKIAKDRNVSVERFLRESIRPNQAP